MRISTHQFHQQAINAVVSKQGELGQTELQVSTGKRILTPSDDPIGTTHIIALKDHISNSEQYVANINNANARLESQENIINSAVNVFQRVHELVLMGANDTLNDADRVNVAKELELRQTELVDLANSKDENGNYIFSGFKGSIKPFAPDNAGVWQYYGDDGTQKISIAPGTKVVVAEPGDNLFSAIKNGNGYYAVAASDTNTGTGVLDVGDVVDPALFTADTYTISMVTNSVGDLAYNIQDSSSTFLIPTPPDDPINDAPLFQSGASISFNGLTTAIKGQPHVGDTFTITPSKNQSVFQTIENAISALKMKDTDRHNAIGMALSDISGALDNFANARAKLGARMNLLSSETTNREQAILTSKKTLSSVEDLDFTQAVSKLTQQATALQAAQQSFLRVQNLNLFNFL